MAIRSRKQWGATAPLRPSMRLPAVGLAVHHSVTNATRNPDADMRTIERIGVQRFGRFSYSFAIHPDGTILTGAGFTMGAHTAGHNSRWFGVVLIGNYENQRVTEAQIGACRWLRSYLIAGGYLLSNAPVRPHRSFKATKCPGRWTMAVWSRLTDSETPLPTKPPTKGDGFLSALTDKEQREILAKVRAIPGNKAITMLVMDALRKALAPKGHAAAQFKARVRESVPGNDAITMLVMDALRKALAPKGHAAAQFRARVKEALASTTTTKTPK